MPGPGLITVYPPAKGDYLRADARDDEYGNKDSHLAAYYALFASSFVAIGRVSPANGANVAQRDLTLDPGWTFTGKLVGPDGKPLLGTVAWGTGAPWATERERLKTSANFKVKAFNPRRPHGVFFQHIEKGLVGVVKPPEQNGGSVAVRMEPGATVTGRVVDAQGKPRAGVKLELRFNRKNDLLRPHYPEPIETDRDGRFQIRALLPGYDYHLSTVDGNGRRDRFFRNELRLGETTDLGDVPLERKGAPSPASE